jgi:LmbE family N-acetylglucosaminyl deacetylase
VVIEGRGTTEREWLPFLTDLPCFPLAPLPSRAVVVAPHPDDEVLGVGGLIALLAEVGVAVTVVSVTDGEASPPGGSVGPEVLAALRVAETAIAVAVLGVTAPVEHLHLPDGGRTALLEPLLSALSVDPAAWLIGPWSGDGHPDHEAVGWACEQIAARDGARLLSYPVWAWHWARPPALDLPWSRAHRLDLPAEVQALKEQAISAFVSQTQPLGRRPEDAPVLPQHVLARFRRPYEVLFT